MQRWLVAVPLVIFALVSASWIYQLGVEYDEAHFYPVALEIANATEKHLDPPHGITINHRVIPFMTMPYVGTLDALVYAIPYAIFGDSPVVPRWTNVAIGLLTMLLSYHVAASAGGWPAGLFALGLFLADLELLLHIPTNYGPMVLQQLFTMAAIAVLLKWWKTDRAAYFFLAVAVLALGFHEKLTYIWVVSSLAMAAAITLKKVGRWWLYPAGLMLALVIVSPILYYTIQLPEIVLGFGQANTGLRIPFSEILAQRIHSVDFMLRGTWMLDFTAGPVPESLKRTPALLILFAVSFFTRNATAQLCSLTALGIWLWNLFFPEAGRMHHVLLLAPLWQCAGGILFGTSGKYIRVGLLALISVALFDTTRCLAWYAPRVQETGGANHWSDMTVGAAAWLKAHPELEGLALNWGIARPIFTVSGGKVDVIERAFDEPVTLDRLLARRRIVWLVSDVVPAYGDRWRQVVERAKTTPSEVAMFPSRDGRFHLRAYRFDTDSAALPLGRELQENTVAIPKNFDFLRLETTGQADQDDQHITVEWLDSKDAILFTDSRPMHWLPLLTPHTFDFAPDLYPSTFLRNEVRPGTPARVRIQSKLGSAKIAMRLSLLSYDEAQRPAASEAEKAEPPAKTFKIKLQKPLEELRRIAEASTPPPQPANLRKPDLVDLTTLSPTIKLDIRYASTNNFMDAAMYSRAEAYLQRPAAQALLRVHNKLSAMGYGLLIHDAYRPWRVTKMFWEATPPAQRNFVANPEKGSRHNRGCAVDLSIYDLKTGQAIEMPSGYDEFSPRAYPDYPGGTKLQRYHRGLLRRLMESESFVVNDDEWWHYDFKEWRQYPVLNLSFEQLGVR